MNDASTHGDRSAISAVPARPERSEWRIRRTSTEQMHAR
jgi:hypothetical protein